MADFKTHSLIGIGIWAIFVLFLYFRHWDINLVLVSFFVSFLGSLAPDTDTPKSKIGKWLELIVFLSAFSFAFSSRFSFSNPFESLAHVFLVTITIFSLFILIRPRHRGATHTIKACAVYAILIFLWIYFWKGIWLGVEFSILAFLSYFSHLVLDSHIKFS
ncbi:MAG: metal-dependent hydrolase [Candidatus Diapherotrites archaeon]|nr:metal-dependent hydrolase [Candidatus Diapherotrites archaeon]